MLEDVDYPSEETLAAWPNCLIPGCPNKCCASLNSIYCWPHTGAGITQGELMKGFKITEKEQSEIQ